MSVSSPFHAAAWRRAIVVIVAAVLVWVMVPPQSAQAAPGLSVDLSVLLVSNGGKPTTAFAALFDREGVPYTTVDVNAPGRQAINDAFLADAATGHGHFQAVVVPDATGSGLSPAEQTALANYERAYGVRQVDADAFPGASTGQGAQTLPGGALDGAAATVTTQGLAGPFTYLKGTFAIDDFDPATDEVYGYLAPPATGLPAGQSFTPLINATKGGATGALVGVYSHDFREELVITASYNGDQQWFNEIGHGLLTWMTRGVHLGYHRNNFTVHVDDIFLPDGRWSATHNCTPGDTPGCVDAAAPDIRMSAADVTRLTTWQNAHDFKLQMLFNGNGSDEWKAEHGGTDPLATAFLGVKSQFTWVNHTYSHLFLGCIQVAPLVEGADWHCATSADNGTTNGAYYNPELVPGSEATSGGIRYLSQAAITAEIVTNQQWAVTNGLPNFDPHALVTGEHSGLLTNPEQPIDNPFLAPALTAAGITYTGSDASREPNSRTVVGGTTKTLPRYPMNIFYNAGHYADEVDEYNWIYTDAPGGSGICAANPDTSTCMATALPNANATQAQASFTNYIVPLEVRNAYHKVITDDPRPFYAHQSNLAEDGILYPVLGGVLDQYKSTYDATKSPIVTQDLVSLGTALNRSTAWSSAQADVTAYIDAAGVHVSGAGGTQVPLTVPTGTTVNGPTLLAYDGELSGWFSAPSSDTVVANITAAQAGYVGHTAPDAPSALVVTPNAEFLDQVDLVWSAPAVDGNAPITGYVIEESTNGGGSWTAVRWPGAAPTSITIGGIASGVDAIFRIQAVNAVGSGPWSAPSASVQRVATASVAAPDVMYGTAATVTLTVENTWGFAPSGTATLTINGSTSAPTPIVGNTVTFSVPGLTAGSYDYTGNYGSDVHIKPLSLTGSVTVTKAAVTATGAVATAPTPVKAGKYQVTVTPPSGLAVPTGEVTVTLTKGDVTTDPITGTLVAGTATLDLPKLAAGTWDAAIVYAGDSNYAQLTTAGSPVTSTKATVIVNGAVGTAPSPQSGGTYSVSVAQGDGLPVPTGAASVTLTLMDGSDPVAGTDPVTVPAATLDATGAATLDVPALAAGTWTASVAYSGDDNYATTPGAGATVVSTKANVTAAGKVVSAPTPQHAGSYKVTVTQPDGLAKPTGNVTVTFANADDTVVKTVALAAGVGTVDLASLSAGTWTTSIAYQGDRYYTSGTGVGDSLDSNKDDVTVTGAVADAPSPQHGGTYSIRVTQPSGDAVPTGDVTLSIVNGLDTVTKTVALAGGVGSVTLDSLPAGRWIASLAYEGDANYTAADATGASVVSTLATVTVTGTVTAAPSPQTGGTYKVTLTQPDGLALPTGEVTLALTHGSDTVSDTVALSGGAAAFTLTSLAAGTWAASISYGGDSNYAAPPATGAPVVSSKTAVSTVVGTVITKPTTTKAGSYKVTVTQPSGLAAATGAVTLTLKLGSATKTINGTLSGGAVTIGVPALAAGTWTAAVAYAGDANYVAKTATGPSVVSAKSAVAKVTTAITKVPTSKKSGSYKVTVTPPSGGAKATGKVTVTLKKGSTTKKVTGTLKSGAVTVTVPKLAKGIWKASVAYAGDATYTAKTVTGLSVVSGKTSVSKLATKVTKVPTTKATGTYTVTVKHAANLATAGGKVTVTLKKGSVTKKVTGTLKSGAVTIKVPKLAKGTWKATVSYSGSSTYLAKKATGASVVVKK